MGREVHILCPLSIQADDCLLWLVGSPSVPSAILSAVRCVNFVRDTTEPDFSAEADELHSLLPRGLEISGAIFVEDGGIKGVEKAGDLAVDMRRALGQVAGPSKPVEVIVGRAVAGTGVVEYNSYQLGEQPKVEALEISQDPTDFQSIWRNMSLLYCRMEFSVPLYLAPVPDASDYKAQLADAVEHIMRDLKSSRVVLLAKGSTAKAQKLGVVLVQPFNQLKTSETASNSSNGPRKEGVQPSSLCSDLSQPPSFLTTSSGAQLPEPVELTVMLQQSHSTNGKVSAPVVHYVPAAENATTIQIMKLSMAVVCMGGSHVPLVDAASDLVLPALRDQLTTMKEISMRNTANKAEVCSYQFCPPGWLHPVTAIYDLSHGETEIALMEWRKKIHRRLGLTLDRPLLRAANAISFKNADAGARTSGSRRLTDVHVGLVNSGVTGGRQSLIQGSYEYYHYLQDRIDDNGWGCAYRSLQTIVSWFRLQHYTTLSVPSHQEIQQMLVDIGDKEPSFVGSKEWIGAIELSFVLDKLLGVSSKILNVQTGADMGSYCRQLALHFETQGTPVMIGGGVLAYTLLGVDYNELTGDSSFLILDPHYTKGEDLKAIRSGGWVGWKKLVSQTGQPFFLQNKFYNLLLPQRPNTV
ncbi:hypothetical protein R1sor_005997 [Riccia sorocarpa]|uniref:Probable Ufm1-specific protease n=1 Tax=Riccia sorocarpa TaxID=122646 RepID=A0ABD3HNG2_9MARC